MTDQLLAVRWRTGGARVALKELKGLLVDLRIDLHEALNTPGPRTDQKLPPALRCSLERLDRAADRVGNEIQAALDTADDSPW